MITVLDQTDQTARMRSKLEQIAVFATRRAEDARSQGAHNQARLWTAMAELAQEE